MNISAIAFCMPFCLSCHCNPESYYHNSAAAAYLSLLLHIAGCEFVVDTVIHRRLLCRSYHLLFTAYHVVINRPWPLRRQLEKPRRLHTFYRFQPYWKVTKFRPGLLKDYAITNAHSLIDYWDEVRGVLYTPRICYLRGELLINGCTGTAALMLPL
jgi:hypothetical protein